MTLKFKVGEKQTIVFTVVAEDYTYDLADSVASLTVADLDGTVLFSKSDSDFDKIDADDELRVQFLEDDLSDTGDYIAELKVEFYDSTGTHKLTEKSRDLEMTIERSLT